MQYLPQIQWQNSSKIPAIDLPFCKLAGFQPATLLKMNSSINIFKDFSQTIRPPFFPNSSLWLIVGKEFLTAPTLGRSPCIQCPTFLKFCPTSQHPPTLFVALFLCVILINDIMDLNLSSLGNLVLTTPCCVFYATRNQIYRRFDTDDMVFASALI